MHKDPKLAWLALSDHTERMDERIAAAVDLAAHMDGGGMPPDGLSIVDLRHALDGADPGSAFDALVTGIVARMLRHPEGPGSEAPPVKTEAWVPGPYRIWDASAHSFVIDADCVPWSVTHGDVAVRQVAREIAIKGRRGGSYVVAEDPTAPGFTCYAIGGAPLRVRW